MSAAIAAGETAYLEDGEEVQVLDVGENYYVIAPALDGGPEGDGPEYGEPRVAKRVFREPPCDRLHERAKRLQAHVDELQAKADALRAEAQRVKSAREEIAALAAKHAAVARVVDHIEGKTTHFVVCNWHGVNIQAADAATDTCDREDRRRGDRKLLTLFGTNGGGLEWRLNDYKDGSGIYRTAIPCTSHEEALAELTRLLDEKIAEIVKLGHAHWLAEPIKNADKYGVLVADDVREMARAYAIETARKDLAGKDAIAEKARAELRLLTGEASS